MIIFACLTTLFNQRIISLKLSGLIVLVVAMPHRFDFKKVAVSSLGNYACFYEFGEEKVSEGPYFFTNSSVRLSNVM